MTEDSLIGKQLDEYRLEAVLGHGGMARVYRGVDVRLKRCVAIKVIDAPYQTDPDYAFRFEREAQAIAQSIIPTSSGSIATAKPGACCTWQCSILKGRIWAMCWPAIERTKSLSSRLTRSASSAKFAWRSIMPTAKASSIATLNPPTLSWINKDARF